MRRLKKVIATVLMIMIVCTSQGVLAMAEDVDTTPDERVGETTQNVEESAGNAEEPESADEAMKKEELPPADTTALLSYVYVDEKVVNVPKTQNIAIAFTDEAMVLEAATLTERSKTTEETQTMESTEIVNNTVLFTKEYNDGPTEDEYQLVSLTYKIQGEEQEKTVLFLDAGIEAGYQVTMGPEEEADTAVTEPTAEFTAYTIDEAGNTVEQSGDSIEEVVDTVLEEAGAKPVSDMPAESSRSESRSALSARSRNVKVALSPGHDANHPGAGANGLSEYILSLKVAQYCKEELESYSGVSVYMTRNSPSCPYSTGSSSTCNANRINAAVAWGANVYVDIHFNAGGGTGAEIFVPNKNFNPGVGQEGEALANEILNQLSALGLKNRGVKVKDSTLTGSDGNYPDGSKADYYTTNIMCKEAGIPGIIVEHAFLDNGDDAAKLRDEAFIKRLGVADATGIARKYGLSKQITQIEVPPGYERKLEATSHVQDIGWMNPVQNGALSGTVGMVKSMEALKLKVNAEGVGIKYRAHVQNIGWMNYAANGEMSGTTGQNKRLEAMQMELTGTNASKYVLYYRAHVSDVGWLGWAKGGQEAGSQGYNRGMEALQIVILPAGSAAPGEMNNHFMNKSMAAEYRAHVRDYGWQAAVQSGSVAGTTGEVKSIEALTVNTNAISGVGIQYKAHVRNIGWMREVANGAVAGTTGRALSIEAVTLKLTGTNASKYDVYYRTHVQDKGWLGWAKNGKESGTEGYALSVEAIQIEIRAAGSGAPGSTANSFVKK